MMMGAIPSCWRRVAAVVAGLALGVDVGLSVVGGEPAAVIATFLLAAVLAVLARMIAPRDQTRNVVLIVLFAFVVRAALAVLLYSASAVLGRGGGITGDDGAYFQLASMFAQYAHGVPQFCEPPLWCGYGYLSGTFVFIEAGLFWLIGPQLIVAQLMNAAFGAVAVLLVWDMGRRLFNLRAAWFAALILTVYPALVLFSALNLKDPIGTALLLLVMWLIVRIQATPLPWLIVLLLVALQLLDGVREYLFVVVGTIAALVILRTYVTDRPRRPLAALGAGAVLAVMFLNVVAVKTEAMTDKPLAVVEAMRVSMSQGRTSFGIETATPPPGGVGTRPGGGPGATAAPGGTPLPGIDLGERPSGETIGVPASTGTSDTNVFVRTATYLPKGLTYNLFAPFPWKAERIQDVAVIPEMLLWYALLAAAITGAFTQRHRWATLMPIVVYLVTMILVFALIEGNVGTLYRHRATMIVPLVVLLAGQGFVWARERLARRQPIG